MKVYDAAAIRNVAVVGHGGCGKTQLVSAMLFVAGAVNRLGKVDDGTTVTDFDDEEIARKHTLSSSLAFLEWQKTKINIIDTPGFANFLSDAKSALRVAEGALVCVDAVAGVEVQTEKLWAEAASLNLPRIVAVNRLERERASLERTLESLRRDCGREIIPIQLPIGEERAFTGVVDLVRMKAFTFAADSSGKMTEGDVPPALAERAAAAREQLIEMVAEADEQLMETFFSEGTLTQEQLLQGLKAATMAGKIFPLVCTSGLHAIGIQPLLDAIVSYVPSPAERDFPALTESGDATAIKASDTAPYIGVRLEDDRRPVRRTHHDAAGDRGNAEAGHERPQPDARQLGALRPPAGPPGQDPDAGARAEGGRPRRGGEAEGHANQRRARGEEHQGEARGDQVPRGGALLRDRAEEPR